MNEGKSRGPTAGLFLHILIGALMIVTGSQKLLASVPPGPHAGNLDLSELSEGSTLYIPVWKPGALIYTGDSHAVQGDAKSRSPPSRRA